MIDERELTAACFGYQQGLNVPHRTCMRAALEAAAEARALNTNNAQDENCPFCGGKKFGRHDPMCWFANNPPNAQPVTTEQLDVAQFGRVLHQRPDNAQDGDMNYREMWEQNCTAAAAAVNRALIAEERLAELESAQNAQVGASVGRLAQHLADLAMEPLDELSAQKYEGDAASILEFLAAPNAQVGTIAEDWKLVPVEPTWEMLAACRNALRDYFQNLSRNERQLTKGKRGYEVSPRVKARLRYRAMVAASPIPPANAQVRTMPSQDELAGLIFNHIVGRSFNVIDRAHDAAPNIARAVLALISIPPELER